MPPVQQGPLLHLHLDVHFDRHLVVRSKCNALVTYFFTEGPYKYKGYLEGVVKREIRLLNLVAKFVAELFGCHPVISIIFNPPFPHVLLLKLDPSTMIDYKLMHLKIFSAQLEK